jgi:hypothetical protein
MINVADKSIVPGNAEETAKATKDSKKVKLGESGGISFGQDKSTKDSKKVKLGESGGISF